MEVTAAAGNPFSTRHVRPGALAYLFPPGESAANILQRLRDNRWQGAIVGPHGSGKSTLLAGLMREIAICSPISARPEIRFIALHEGQRSLPHDFVLPRSGEEFGVVIVDGYEQLSWWSRRKLLSRCRSAGWGLLVTAHGPCGIAEIYRTHSSLATTQLLVAQLLPAADLLIAPDDIAAAFLSHAGNVRETLFALYDVYEARRSDCAVNNVGR